MFRFLRHLRQIDPVLAACAVLLMAIGVVGIASTTARGATDTRLVTKQLIAIGIGVVLFYLMTFVSTDVLRRYAYPAFIILILALIAVLFTPAIRGTRGWFALGGFQFQPAEFGKVIMLLLLARYFAAIAPKTSRFQFVLVSGLLLLLPAVLMLMQPDLGTAFVYVVCWAALLLLSGLKKRFVLVLFASALLMGGLGWTVLLKDYQKGRIESFLNPEQDPLGQGYNLIQSKIAVGSGQWFGRGLGHGSQSQLRFLPERHTDFIFAVIAEELGFVGGALVLTLFFVLLLRGVKIAREAGSEYGLMLASGAVAMLGYQAFINIGMNMGILPVTGVPLPFVSYGGTSMITTLLLLGILQLVAQEGKPQEGMGR